MCFSGGHALRKATFRSSARSIPNLRRPKISSPGIADAGDVEQPNKFTLRGPQIVTERLEIRYTILTDKEQAVERASGQNESFGQVTSMGQMHSWSGAEQWIISLSTAELIDHTYVHLLLAADLLQSSVFRAAAHLSRLMHQKSTSADP
ncbi:hypothetical protein R1flu_010276 [Riccia fluitans]|uniref:Uncharacterized protein n=1 Tax=Riccia fluitans TaxID=41844 RepID=A0ABD1Z4J0_9MARC